MNLPFVSIPTKEIFVFGSNLAGRHGKGAALCARNEHGAQYGVGEGRTGNSYAIPTKDHQIKSRKLSEVRESINKFIEYANNNPKLTFNVTRVGCGLAGFKVQDIAPMFKNAPTNCKLHFDEYTY